MHCVRSRPPAPPSIYDTLSQWTIRFRGADEWPSHQAVAFPEYAATITGIVLAAVVIFEVIGPLLTRRALFATGEAKTVPSPLLKAESGATV